MKISIIGDTHFSHKNIQEYCDRPKEWEILITENLCKLTEALPDVLIHLGDVSLGNEELCHGFFDILDCKRWLVLGNHDNKSITWYLNHGWDFVGRNFTLYYFGLRIFFSHRPSIIPPTKILVNEIIRENKIEQVITKERSNFNINVHGHIHNRKDLILPKWCKPYIIEDQDYKPIDLKEFLSEEIRQKSRENNT